jgi:NAD(P)H-flavin reductase
LAQIYATFILITGKSTIEFNIFAIFIIQISAFMGTLSRKNIINNFQWHMIYLFQYALFFFSFFKNSTIFIFNNKIPVFLLWMLRTKLNVNKFFLWSCVSVIVLFTKYIKSNILLCSALGLLYACFQKYNLCFDKKREEMHTIIKTNVIVPETNLHVIDIKLKHSVDYNPGQYFNLYMDKEKRPYTPIAADKENNSLRFFIKDYANNKISEKICALKKDMCIHVEGPFGKSYYDKATDLLMVHHKSIETKNILFFYCGTGITPFASILNSLNPNTRYRFKLFGSLRTPAENYFQDIKQKLFYSTNKLTPRKIHKIIKKYKPSNTTIFVCGNKNYMNMLCETIVDKFNICKLE